MGKVTLKYFGILTVKLNLYGEEIEIPDEGIKLKDLVEVLKLKHGEEIEKYISKGYQIFIDRDGKSYNMLQLEKYETKIINNDKLLFLYGFAGG